MTVNANTGMMLTGPIRRAIEELFLPAQSLPPGTWRTTMRITLEDSHIDVAVEVTDSLPEPIRRVAGALVYVRGTETVYRMQDGEWVEMVTGIDLDPSQERNTPVEMPANTWVKADEVNPPRPTRNRRRTMR